MCSARRLRDENKKLRSRKMDSGSWLQKHPVFDETVRANSTCVCAKSVAVMP